MSRKFRNKRAEKEYAKSQVQNYFSNADAVFGTDPERATRYVALARKTAMRYQVRIPPEYRRRFCKHCYTYLRPGANALVRTSPRGGGRVIIECRSCKNHMRFPYLKEKKLKRNVSSSSSN